MATLRELSEVNFGLVIDGRLPATLYKPEWFCTPYDKGIEVLLQKGKVKEDVAKVVSPEYISDAHDSVKRWNGIGETENFDWATSLKNAYINAERGKKFQKMGKKLENNDDVDILALYSELGSAIANESSGLQLLKDVDYKNYKPFKKCGYAPIDNTLGGIPTDGPIIIYGLTGVGKSRLATAIINGLLHQYPNDTAAIYTLEMPADHWAWRSLDLFPSLKEVQDRLHISGAVRDIEELVAEITAKKVNYVVLDDIDNIVKSSDASEYERVYRRVKEICRFMHIPVFVLCQPNRQAKWDCSNSNENNRFLGPYDIAWSGSAENSAALQIAIMTTNSLDMKSDQFPTTDTNQDYLIFWKSRDGWPADRDAKAQRGPGAVVMSHTKDWNGVPYGGRWRIHSPEAGNKSIGKKKSKKED